MVHSSCRRELELRTRVPAVSNVREPPSTQPRQTQICAELVPLVRATTADHKTVPSSGHTEHPQLGPDAERCYDIGHCALDRSVVVCV